MPMDVRRLLASETWVLGTGDERAAAMCLWLESWHQVPAASLPDHPRMLAHLAQCTKWQKVGAHALRGWMKCSDGRLYHPVVAEKALEAWVEKLLNYISGAAGNAKRWAVEINTATQRLQLVHAVDMLRNLAPASRTLKKKAVIAIASGSPPDSPPDSGRDSSPDSALDSSPESSADRKGQGQGQGQGFIHSAPIGAGAVGAAIAPMSPLEQAALMPQRKEGEPLTEEQEKLLWSGCRYLLAEQGVSPDAAGTFIGRLIKDVGGDRALVFDVMRDACIEKPLGVRAWMRAACKQRHAGATPKKSTASTHAGFDDLNYQHGVQEDGTLAL